MPSRQGPAVPPRDRPGCEAPWPRCRPSTATRPGQRRQRVGDVVVHLGAVEPHQPGEVLLCGGRSKAGFGGLRRQFRVEDLLAGLARTIERARPAQLQGQLRGGIRGLRGLRQKGHRLEGGDGVDPGGSRRVGERQRVDHGLHLRALELRLRHLDTPPTRRRVEEIHADQRLDRPECAQFGRTDPEDAQGDHRVLGRRLLPDLGCRQADLGIGRLQPAIVEERDLHGGVRRDRALMRQSMNLLTDLLRLRGALEQHRAAPRGSLRAVGHQPEARAGGGDAGRQRRGAGAERQWQQYGCSFEEYHQPRSCERFSSRQSAGSTTGRAV